MVRSLVFITLFMAALWCAGSAEDVAFNTCNSGVWTNRAGHVLHAVPVSIIGERVVFERQGENVTYSCSIFPPSEQERIRTVLGDLTLPEGLLYAFSFHQESVKRMRVRLDNDLCSKKEFVAARDRSVDAFSRQAETFVKSGALSKKRLSFFLDEIAAAGK